MIGNMNTRNLEEVPPHIHVLLDMNRKTVSVKMTFSRDEFGMLYVVTEATKRVFYSCVFCDFVQMNESYKCDYTIWPLYGTDHMRTLVADQIRGISSTMNAQINLSVLMTRRVTYP